MRGCQIRLKIDESFFVLKSIERMWPLNHQQISPRLSVNPRKLEIL